MASVYSVSQVNAYIKNMFAQDFALSRISVRGEVSNCKYHSSGHIYFTLKDNGSAISAVMFASHRHGLSFRLEEGQQVVAKGSVEVYQRDGRYQLYAQEIALDGRGSLFDQFQKLRAQLEEMGMFAPEYKQPIPAYATRIGVVTASTGAAIQDIRNISSRRNPYVQLVLYPAQVQGEGAKESIAQGIKTLDQMGLDVIILGRGGGSIEDLWAFNEEMVARAIFECSTPTISAVGHETDVTIADYVADMRAPTPSAAAELAVFDYSQFESRLNRQRQVLSMHMADAIGKKRSQAEQLQLRLKLHDPRRQLGERRQRLADMEERLQEGIGRKALESRRDALSMEGRIREGIRRKLADGRHRLELLGSRLDGLSPLKKLGGGFGFITDGQGCPVKSAKRLRPGDQMEVWLKDGQASAQVKEVKAWGREVLPWQQKRAEKRKQRP